MKKPSNLKAGDQVALVCTARAISADELAFAIDKLKSWKLVPVLGKTIGLRDNQYGGTDEERIRDFQEMMDNEQIKAIFCARGGYGTVRILDALDFTKFKKNPKWVIGFSDITALHFHLMKHCKTMTLHAAMPSTYESTEMEAVEGIKRILFGETEEYEFAPHPFNRTGQATGKVIGGNLSVLYSLIGSNSLGKFKGKILLLEDLDEYLYHVDRMVVNIKRAGLFEDLAGLLFGGMTKMQDNTIPFGKTAEEIILEHTAEYDYPICFGFPSGHWARNYPVVLGKKSELIVEKGLVKFW